VDKCRLKGRKNIRGMAGYNQATPSGVGRKSEYSDLEHYGTPGEFLFGLEGDWVWTNAK